MDEHDDYFWTYFLIFLGEATGTAFLLFFGCMGLIGSVFLDGVLPAMQPAIIWGTVITGVVMMFGHITRGHFNPCVTVSALILRIISPWTALVYFAAELIGSTFGYWLLTVSIPRNLVGDVSNSLNKTEGFCNTILHNNIATYQGILLEFMATSFLIYAVNSAWDPRNAIWSDSVALKFGFVVTAMVICVGPFTGASLNPARSFGPALINRVWTNHWVYWVACIGAAIVTTSIYKYTYLRDAENYLRSKEKLSDQFRQGSLYSKNEETESLAPRSKTDLKLKDLNLPTPKK